MIDELDPMEDDPVGSTVNDEVLGKVVEEVSEVLDVVTSDVLGIETVVDDSEAKVEVLIVEVEL